MMDLNLRLGPPPPPLAGGVEKPEGPSALQPTTENRISILYIFNVYRSTSLDTHPKHNIIHGNINFHFPYPPSDKRKVLDYKAANTHSIRNEILKTDWKSLFYNINGNEMSIMFTGAIVDIIPHVPNKIITCDDKDTPLITPKIKTDIKRKSRVYRKWISRKLQENSYDQEVQNTTNKLMKNEKCDYYVITR